MFFAQQLLSDIFRDQLAERLSPVVAVSPESAFDEFALAAIN